MNQTLSTLMPLLSQTGSSSSGSHMQVAGPNCKSPTVRSFNQKCQGLNLGSSACRTDDLSLRHSTFLLSLQKASGPRPRISSGKERSLSLQKDLVTCEILKSRSKSDNFIPPESFYLLLLLKNEMTFTWKEVCIGLHF